MKIRTNVAILALVASVLGLVFAAYSTFDYAQHLDRQIHAIHCSFIPGASATNDAENPCKAALFSPYSALFRESFWGGVPISLFAVGAFSFFIGFALYLLAARDRASRKAYLFLGLVGLTPLIASIVMFVISLTRLNAFCKVCVGIYASSALLGGAAVLALVHYLLSGRGPGASASSPERPVDPRAPTALEVPAPQGSVLVMIAWLAALGVCAALPAAVYAGALPDYRPFLSSCGKLGTATEPHNALLKMKTERPVQPVTLFEDPLCPTCKAFHERLVDEGVFERLDVTMVMFPLDDCNWMIDRPLHPGACMLSKAVLCNDKKAREILEWSYSKQDDLRELGKANPAGLKAKIADKWGAEVAACADDKAPTSPAVIRLNRHLHFASTNHIPVSTPQMFLGDKRICDEDTDLGLKYTLSELAPGVLK
jgi:uncharacterized membrane protein